MKPNFTDWMLNNQKVFYRTYLNCTPASRTTTTTTLIK